MDTTKSTPFTKRWLNSRLFKSQSHSKQTHRRWSKSGSGIATVQIIATWASRSTTGWIRRPAEPTNFSDASAVTFRRPNYVIWSTTKRPTTSKNTTSELRVKTNCLKGQKLDKYRMNREQIVSHLTSSGSRFSTSRLRAPSPFTSNESRKLCGHQNAALFYMKTIDTKIEYSNIKTPSCQICFNCHSHIIIRCIIYKFPISV